VCYKTTVKQKPRRREGEIARDRPLMLYMSHNHSSAIRKLHSRLGEGRGGCLQPLPARRHIPHSQREASKSGRATMFDRVNHAVSSAPSARSNWPNICAESALLAHPPADYHQTCRISNTFSRPYVAQLIPILASFEAACYLSPAL